MSKKHFYCWYLGFTEVASCNEAAITREIVHQLVDYHESQTDSFSKVTLTLAEAGITILDVQIQQKSTQNRIVNKIYTISYDSLVHVNQHLSGGGIGASVNGDSEGSGGGKKYRDIVTLLTKSQRLKIPVESSTSTSTATSSSSTPPPKKQQQQQQQMKKRRRRSSSSASTPPVFYLHAFRFDSDESAVKMEHYLNLFRANYFSRLKPKSASAATSSSSASSRPRIVDVRRSSSSQSQTSRSSTQLVSQSATSASPVWDQFSHLKNKNLKRTFFFMPFRRVERVVKKQEVQRKNSSKSTSPSTSSASSTSKDASSASSSSSTSPSVDPKGGVELASSSFNHHYLTPRKAVLDDLNREMAEKFASGQPILLPPKDYTKRDRARGDLNEARFRRSQNPIIVGRIAAPPATTTTSTTTTTNTFKSSSIDEQTNEVLKILDDVVNAESAVMSTDDSASSSSSSSAAILPSKMKQETLVFEFKPPQQDVDEEKREFFMNTREFIDVFDDERRHYRFNPLHVIDEDGGSSASWTFERRAAMPPARSLTNVALGPSRVDCLLNTLSTSGDRYKKNAPQSRAVNKKSNSQHHRNDEDAMVAAASSGVRKNVLPRLATYQPQWLPNYVAAISRHHCSSSQEDTTTKALVYVRREQPKQHHHHHQQQQQKQQPSSSNKRAAAADKKFTSSSFSLNSSSVEASLSSSLSKNSEFILKKSTAATSTSSSSTTTTSSSKSLVEPSPGPEPGSGRMHMPIHTQSQQHRAHFNHRFSDVYY